MALSDFETHEAADIALHYDFLFNITQLLSSAFPGVFPKAILQLNPCGADIQADSSP